MIFLSERFSTFGPNPVVSYLKPLEADVFQNLDFFFFILEKQYWTVGILINIPGREFHRTHNNRYL